MKDSLTWRQIKDWWPILVALVSITTLIARIYFKVVQIESSQNETREQIRDLRSEILLWRDQIEARIGSQDIKIAVLEHRK